MRTAFYAAVFLLAALSACKKVDPDVPGVAAGTTVITPTPPPPGFSFPKTYTAGNPQMAFNVWVDEKDATVRFKLDFFFKREPQDILATAQLKFVNTNTIEIVDGTGQLGSETAGYYFFRDTLFLVHLGNQNDTTPIATGNYNGFTLATNKMYVSGKTGNPPTWTKISADNVFALTYQQVYNRYVTDWHYFSELDTVAIENSWYSFK